MSGGAFVVERINWEQHGEGPQRRFNLLPGAVRVACFEDAATADAECRRREAEARVGVNPFTCRPPRLGLLDDRCLPPLLRPRRRAALGPMVGWDRRSPLGRTASGGVGAVRPGPILRGRPDQIH